MLNPRKKYIVKGFANGVLACMDHGFTGLILATEDTQLEIRIDDLPQHYRTYGDKRLFNYLSSLARPVTNERLQEINDSEEKWAKVDLHTMN